MCKKAHIACSGYYISVLVSSGWGEEVERMQSKRADMVWYVTGKHIHGRVYLFVLLAILGISLLYCIFI